MSFQNLYIITPVGSEIGLIKTIESVFEVSKRIPLISFTHLLIYNNNCHFDNSIYKESENYKIKVYDLNPVSSRSLARNYGLKKIDNEKNNYVIFLDVDDLLLPNAIEKIQKKYFDLNDNKIFWCHSLVRYKNVDIKVIDYPFKLLPLMNVIYLSSIILPSNIAKLYNFPSCYKEDWIYWYKVFSIKRPIVKINLPNYIYFFQSIKKQTNKKIKSFSNIIQTLSILNKKKNIIFNLLLSIIYLFLSGLKWIVTISNLEIKLILKNLKY